LARGLQSNLLAVWFAVLIIPKALLLVGGAIVAFRVRNVPGDYNGRFDPLIQLGLCPILAQHLLRSCCLLLAWAEARHIFVAVYNIVLMCGLGKGSHFASGRNLIM
jgi:hypothetical protein